jgi:hypothetical protein
MFRGAVIPRNINKLINSTGTGQVMFIPMLQAQFHHPNTSSLNSQLKSITERKNHMILILNNNNNIKLSTQYLVNNTQRLTISKDIYTTLTHVHYSKLRFLQ